MPTPQTALQLIESSCRLIGVLASGEQLTADEANDALNALKDLLENWSTEELSVWGRSTETFNTVAGQATYTIGPGGNWDTDRPVRIASAYSVFSGVSYPLLTVGQEQYDALALKTLQEPIPQQLLYVNDNPLGRITLYPVPSDAIPVVLSIDRVLDSDITLATSLVYPPGYAKALRFALAVELCPEFGQEVGATVLQIATDAKADIKRANIKLETATYDAALLDNCEYANWQRGY